MQWTCISRLDIPLGPGVYEVVYKDDVDGLRLQIGETIHLHEHLRKNLVADPRNLAVGGRIKANEDVMRLLVRWAETVNHSAVKSELMDLHVGRFGRRPKHVLR